MTSSSFVFELGCEELPSSALPSINSQLHSLFKEKIDVCVIGFLRYFGNCLAAQSWSNDLGGGYTI